MLDLFGHLRLDQIGARQIEAYKARRKQDGVGNKTINEELTILSKILGYAEEIGELRKPPPKIRRLKVAPPPFDFLDFDEADRLLATARDAPDPWRAMIPFTMWTGLRLGELRGLAAPPRHHSGTATPCKAQLPTTPSTKTSGGAQESNLGFGGRRNSIGTGNLAADPPKSCESWSCCRCRGV